MLQRNAGNSLPSSKRIHLYHPCPLCFAVDVKLVFDSLRAFVSPTNLSPNNFVVDGLLEHNNRIACFSFSIRKSFVCTIACARFQKVSLARSLSCLYNCSSTFGTCRLLTFLGLKCFFANVLALSAFGFPLMESRPRLHKHSFTYALQRPLT